MLNARTTRVEKRNGETVLTVEGSQGAVTITGSHLLVATGRLPNSDELDLARAGVATDKNGFIKVNGRLETNIPGIWALGDERRSGVYPHFLQ
jgi:pyruvate/2-oxoglutarate dehydrogenase complex dihydrolipoamide dehydrogenase (E3) component